jgi:hypothetical protein
MKKSKKYLSIILLSCLFLCTTQFTVYATDYVLSGGGYYTSRVTITNNMLTFSSYFSPAQSAWNNATSRVNITTGLWSNNTIDSYDISDSYWGLNGISSTSFYIVINSVKNTSSTAQSVIVHELGHVFNLADNNNILLATVPIMSNYRDRTVVKTPTSIDIAGVNASYNISGNKY